MLFWPGEETNCFSILPEEEGKTLSELKLDNGDQLIFEDAQDSEWVDMSYCVVNVNIKKDLAFIFVYNFWNLVLQKFLFFVPSILFYTFQNFKLKKLKKFFFTLTTYLPNGKWIYHKGKSINPVKLPPFSRVIIVCLDKIW